MIEKIHLLRFPYAALVQIHGQFVLYLALWTWIAVVPRLTRSDFILHIGRIYFYERDRGAWKGTNSKVFKRILLNHVVM